MYEKVKQTLNASTLKRFSEKKFNHVFSMDTF